MTMGEWIAGMEEGWRNVGWFAFALFIITILGFLYVAYWNITRRSEVDSRASLSQIPFCILGILLGVAGIYSLVTHGVNGVMLW